VLLLLLLLILALLTFDTVVKCVYNDFVCLSGFRADFVVDVEGLTLMIGRVRCFAAELIVAL
jgi:hypothetical protein